MKRIVRRTIKPRLDQVRYYEALRRLPEEDRGHGSERRGRVG
ncbi:MAG: hypothetical protein M5R40_20545 [Anaerolineae bacterium]|nr:hypothetical protein [Anaerolineae bacterium]